MASTNKDESKNKIKFWWVNKSQRMKKYEIESFVFAYQAVMDKVGEVGITVLKEVMIRHTGHAFTTQGGKPRKAVDHWTIAFKGEEQVKNGTHYTIHGHHEKGKKFKWIKSTFDEEGALEMGDSNIKAPVMGKDKKKPFWPTELQGLCRGSPHEMTEEDLKARVASIASQS